MKKLFFSPNLALLLILALILPPQSAMLYPPPRYAIRPELSRRTLRPSNAGMEESKVLLQIKDALNPAAGVEEGMSRVLLVGGLDLTGEKHKKMVQDWLQQLGRSGIQVDWVRSPQEVMARWDGPSRRYDAVILLDLLFGGDPDRPLAGVQLIEKINSEGSKTASVAVYAYDVTQKSTREQLGALKRAGRLAAYTVSPETSYAPQWFAEVILEPLDADFRKDLDSIRRNRPPFSNSSVSSSSGLEEGLPVGYFQTSRAVLEFLRKYYGIPEGEYFVPLGEHVSFNPFDTPHELFLTAVERAAPLMQGKEVLEIGTAHGEVVSAAVVLSGAARGVGIDIDQEAVALGREYLSKFGLTNRVELLAGDMFAPVAGRQFDWVISNTATIEMAERFIASIGSFLRPDGVALLQPWDGTILGEAAFASPDLYPERFIKAARRAGLVLQPVLKGPGAVKVYALAHRAERLEEVRKLFAEGGDYERQQTDPRNHDDQNFTYFVHMTDELAADLLGATGILPSMLTEPYRQELISTSIVHRDPENQVLETYRNQRIGYILRVPRGNIAWVAPFDFFSDRNRQSLRAILGERGERGLLPFNELIESSQRYQTANEALVFGTGMDGKKVETVGVVVLQDSSGTDESEKIHLVEKAQELGLPVVRIRLEQRKNRFVSPMGSQQFLQQLNLPPNPTAEQLEAAQAQFEAWQNRQSEAAELERESYIPAILRSQPVPTPLSSGLEEETLDFTNAKGEKIAAAVMKPAGPGPFPVALVFHGLTGNKEEEHIRKLAERLTEVGYLTIRPDFRNNRQPKQDQTDPRFNQSDGELSEYSLEGVLEDVATLVENVRKIPSVLPEADLSRGVVLAGHSYGGWTARHVAALSFQGDKRFAGLKVQAVADLSGVIHPRASLLRTLMNLRKVDLNKAKEMLDQWQRDGRLETFENQRYWLGGWERYAATADLSAIPREIPYLYFVGDQDSLVLAQGVEAEYGSAVYEGVRMAKPSAHFLEALKRRGTGIPPVIWPNLRHAYAGPNPLPANAPQDVLEQTIARILEVIPAAAAGMEESGAASVEVAEGMARMNDFLRQVGSDPSALFEPGVHDLTESFGESPAIQAFTREGNRPLLLVLPARLSLPGTSLDSPALKLLVDPKYERAIREQLSFALVSGIVEITADPSAARFVVGDRDFVRNQKESRLVSREATFLQVDPSTLSSLTQDFLTLVAVYRPGAVLVVGTQTEQADAVVLFESA